jgi:hypothetical protein
MRSDGLTVADWAVITEYMDVLKPLNLATKRFEERSDSGRFGAIAEIIPVFFDSFHLDSPFLIYLQRYSHAAALWARTVQLEILQTKNFQWSVRDQDVRSREHDNQQKKGSARIPSCTPRKQGSQQGLTTHELEIKKRDRTGITSLLPLPPTPYTTRPTRSSPNRTSTVDVPDTIRE